MAHRRQGYILAVMPHGLDSCCLTPKVLYFVSKLCVLRWSPGQATCWLIMAELHRNAASCLYNGSFSASWKIIKFQGNTKVMYSPGGQELGTLLAEVVTTTHMVNRKPAYYFITFQCFLKINITSSAQWEMKTHRGQLVTGGQTLMLIQHGATPTGWRGRWQPHLLWFPSQAPFLSIWVANTCLTFLHYLRFPPAVQIQVTLSKRNVQN